MGLMGMEPKLMVEVRFVRSAESEGLNVFWVLVQQQRKWRMYANDNESRGIFIVNHLKSYSVIKISKLLNINILNQRKI